MVRGKDHDEDALMVFSSEERSGLAFIEQWARRWWPFLPLALGVAVVVGGAILFSP